ncbi:MAG: hypothetical protein RBS57_17170, partial [Desulforhabdus sp.]|nr:hypothetical protein [Desulforhabdus sp.]
PEGGIDALIKNRDELIAQQEAQPIIADALDLVAFSFEKVKEEKHKLRWYFIVKNDINADWIFKVRFKVDKSHIGELPKDAPYREDGLMYLNIRPDRSKISDWKQGEHQVLTMDVNLKSVPYDIGSQFYQWFPDKPQVYGNPISHGWQVDLGEE